MSTIRATYVQHGSSAVPNITLNASGQVIVASGIVSSGTFAAPSGSVSAPGIYFNGDSNTGLYSPAADTIAFTEGGVEALRIDSSGRVGIGSSNPQALLHLSNTAQQRFSCTSTTNAISFWRDGTPSFAAEVGLGSATGIANALKFDVFNGSSWNTAVNIDSSSRVGIGTTSPGAPLEVNGNVRITNANNLQLANTGDVQFLNAAGTSYSTGIVGSSDNMILYTTDLERCRLDSSGRLLVGTSTARANFNNASATALAQIEGTTAANSSLSLVNNSTGDTSYLYLGRSKGTTVGSNSLVSANDFLGVVSFQGSDGTEFVEAAAIYAQVDGTPGANDMPGRLVFSTTADGASSPTERMRITNAGNILLASTETSLSSGLGIKLNASGSTPQVGVVVNTTSADTGNYHLYNLNATYNGFRFYVRNDGGIANFSANNQNLSDRSVKKDISPAADTWDCIKEWEIVNYRYKDQPDDADLNLGVIAQQVAENCPEVVTIFQEETDDEPAKLGVKEQKMYWMAIKALQEAQVRIEILEAEVAALKAS